MIRLPSSRPVRVMLAIVAVLLLAGVAYGIWAYTQQRETTAPEAEVELVDEAAQAMRDNDESALQSVAERVAQQRNYEQVPEYVYIVARAEAAEGNADEVRRLLDIFREFDENASYVGEFAAFRHINMLAQLEVELQTAEAIDQSNQDTQPSPGGGAVGLPDEV